MTQATLSRILATAVGDPQGSALVADEADGKIDQSGSGSGTAGTKWHVLDGYIALHIALGPAAGRFTNNLFRWLHEEGACDAQLAAVDWSEVPERRRARALARRWPRFSRARPSARWSRRRSSGSCSPRRS